MKSEPFRDRATLIKFTDHLGKTSGRNRMSAVAGFHLGIRGSDLAGLRVCDVSGPYLDLKEKKTKKRVRRLITNELRRELDIYTQGMKPGDYLFPSRFGSNQPLTRAGIYKFMRKAADELGLQYVGTHTLRKTFGWFYYQKWKDVAKLQKLLNHSKPDDTMLYIGIVQDDLDDSLRDFDPMAPEEII